MSDDRIFRVTYASFPPAYANRRSLSGKLGRGWKAVTSVEATSPEATEGWTDVTREFFPERNQPLIDVLPAGPVPPMRDCCDTRPGTPHVGLCQNSLMRGGDGT